MSAMHEPDDDPLEDVFAEAREERHRYDAFLAALRESDPAFAEASALQPDDISEWQAAAYLLSGNDQVWAALGARVLAERSIGPVLRELGDQRRAWNSSEEQVMLWAAHFWDVEPPPGAVPVRVRALPVPPLDPRLPPAQDVCAAALAAVVQRLDSKPRR